METIKLTLIEFYDLVWSKSLLGLSKEYNISDNGIRKKCKKYGIPFPQNGYWATTEERREKLKKPFKCLKEFSQEIIYLESRSTDCTSGILRTKFLENKISQDYQNLLNNDGTLNNSEPIIKLIKETIKNNQSKTSYRYRNSNVYIDFASLKIDITTIELKRILILINVIFKILSDFGFDKEALKMGKLSFNGLPFSMTFREKSTAHRYKDKNGWNTQELIPNGKLEIILFNGWWDFLRVSDRNTIVESRLATIVAKIITNAEERYKKHLEQEEAKKEQLRRERYNEIRNKIIKQDKMNFEMFAQDYDTWQKMLKLNEFISIIENTNVNPTIEAHKQEWLEWAKEKANQMDPLKLGVENYLTRFEIVPIPEEI